MQQSISVVVPVYNSQDSLEPLTDRLCRVLKDCSNAFEIILVNDGSRDMSWEKISRLVDSNSAVRGINLMRNYGQHNALLAGIRAAQQELIVTIDDDLQHPPEEIPKLLNELARGYDVVYGAPREETHQFSRNLASQMTKLAFQSILNVKAARKISAFRVFRTSLRTAFDSFNAPHPSIDVLLTWATTRFSFVDVQHNERQIGASNYNLMKLFAHAMNMMTGYSTMPLRIASLLGFGFTLFGIGVFLYVFVRYMVQGTPVQGFTFLASVISIFSGVQLFVFGIFGEYLARMYSRVMDRPTYVIQELKKQVE